MEWGTEAAIIEIGKVPDIIYDEGGMGKEPMIRILGKNPNDVVVKLRQIVEMVRNL
jgi:hydroxymethylpyrimidine/phosphomethylpyrimidine kinase